MWRLLLGTMGVKSLVQGLNAAATAGFEPRTVWSEVRRRNRLATAPPHMNKDKRRLTRDKQNFFLTTNVTVVWRFGTTVSSFLKETINGKKNTPIQITKKEAIFSTTPWQTYVFATRQVALKWVWRQSRKELNLTKCMYFSRAYSAWARQVLPWTKKRTIPEICGEKNAVPSCDIMLDDARSAQGESCGQLRMTLPCADRASLSMISQDRTAFFSPRISGMVLFFLSRVVHCIQFDCKHYLIVPAKLWDWCCQNLFPKSFTLTMWTKWVAHVADSVQKSELGGKKGHQNISLFPDVAFFRSKSSFFFFLLICSRLVFTLHCFRRPPRSGFYLPVGESSK